MGYSSEPDAEFREWLFLRSCARQEAMIVWKAHATTISDGEYDAIPLNSYSLIPMGFLGEAKIDSESKLVAYKYRDHCLHRSPTYEGPL